MNRIFPLTSKKWSVFISLQGVSTIRAANRSPSAAFERHWTQKSLELSMKRTWNASEKSQTVTFSSASSRGLLSCPIITNSMVTCFFSDLREDVERREKMEKALAMAHEDANTSGRSHTICGRKSHVSQWVTKPWCDLHIWSLHHCKSKTWVVLFSFHCSSEIYSLIKLKCNQGHWPRCSGCFLQAGMIGPDGTETGQRTGCCACWPVKEGQPLQHDWGTEGNCLWGLGSKHWVLPAKSENHGQKCSWHVSVVTL